MVGARLPLAGLFRVSDERKSGAHLRKIVFGRVGRNQVLDAAIRPLKDLINETGLAQGIQFAVQRRLTAERCQAHRLAHGHGAAHGMLKRNFIEQRHGIFIQRGQAFLLNSACNVQKPKIQVCHEDVRNCLCDYRVSPLRATAKGKLAFHNEDFIHRNMIILFTKKQYLTWLTEYFQSFILLSLAYAGIYFLNNSVTGFLYLAPAAHFIHIPSGFKLLFVLIGRWAGAAAIACVSFVNAFFIMFQGDLLLDIGLACASGLSPLLTWLFFKHRLKMAENLENIRYRHILMMGIFFAVLNSVLHQLVLFWNDTPTDFVKGFLIMGIGA